MAEEELIQVLSDRLRSIDARLVVFEFTIALLIRASAPDVDANPYLKTLMDMERSIKEAIDNKDDDALGIEDLAENLVEALESLRKTSETVIRKGGPDA